MRRHSLLNQVLQRIQEYEGHVYFVTLTMRDDSALNKNSIGNFLVKLRYRGVTVDGYLWVKELQKRGVVHFHLIILVPEKIRSFYTLVSESWKFGFVFVRGVERNKIRNAINYIMKYIKKDCEIEVQSEKMKRRIGRGGLLRFKIESFIERVVRFTEFQYVGGAMARGIRLKIYRHGSLIMFVTLSMYGISIDIVDWDTEKIVEKFKHHLSNSWKLASIMNNLQYLVLNRLEQEDIVGYHRFVIEIDKLLWKLGVS